MELVSEDFKSDRGWQLLVNIVPCNLDRLVALSDRQEPSSTLVTSNARGLYKYNNKVLGYILL